MKNIIDMPLTELLKDIRAKQIELNIQQDRIRQEAAYFYVNVLNHFNNYVELEINPKLPEGHKLLPASQVDYTLTGQFEITTGVYQTPDKEHGGPLPLERIILPLLKEYEAQNHWIKVINPGFEVSK